MVETKKGEQIMFLINPDSEEFRWFLVWLVEEKDFNASEIIGVMYESHKYQDLEKEYKQDKEIK